MGVEREDELFDVIIVGAGMGGLMAGNALALGGRRVLIVEQHVIPGGYTTNFEREDFRFEISTHLINGCGPGGVIYEHLRRVGAHERMQFAKVDTLMHWRDLQHGRELALPAGLDAFVDTLVSLFPAEEEGLRGFYGKYGRLAEFLFEISKVGPESEQGAALLASYPGALDDLFELRERTAEEVLAQFVSDPELKDMMTMLSGFFGLCPEELDAFIFVMGDLAYRLPNEGAWYPIGGSGHMTQVLAELFEERGGRLLLKNRVTAVKIEDGRATGVRLRDRRGRESTVRGRCLIANSDLTELASKLVTPGDFPSEFVERIEKRVPCCSAVVIYAGLDIDLRERGLDGYEIHATWGEHPTAELINEISRTADYTRLPSGSVTIYSNIDPGCCPSGKSVVSTICFAEPEVFERALDEGARRGHRYRALKRRITGELLAMMGRTLAIEDLEAHVEVVELATPITLRRYTRNRNGSFVGWRYTPNQSALNPLPQESPIQNLLLCGQWVAPGGGVAPVMASGLNAAALAEQRLSGQPRHSAT